MKIQSFGWLDRLEVSYTTVVFVVGLPLAVSDYARLNTDAEREERGSVVLDLDELSGGATYDRFVYPGISGNDIITDCQGGDGASDHVNLRYYRCDGYEGAPMSVTLQLMRFPDSI